MTNITVTPTVPLSRGRLSTSGILRSEWIKLRSVRSTIWCYSLLVLLVIGIGVLIASLIDLQGNTLTADAARSALVNMSIGSLNVAVLIVAVMGSLIITGEYTTGMIRSTFAAVPGRISALIAKAAVLAATTFVTTVVAIGITAFAVRSILASKGANVDLAEPSVFMPLLGGAVYVTLIAVLAFGIGAILRSSAGALATSLGLLMVAPLVIQLLGSLTGADWVSTVSALLPQNAGSQLYTYDGQHTTATGSAGTLTLNGWGGFGVLAAWDAVLLAIALVLVKRRDV